VTSAWNHNTLSLQYKLDNEFELVFVVAYQNILKLTYVDKFLTEIQLRFRDKYKQSIESGEFDRDFNDFRPDFDKILRVNFNLLYFYSNNPKLSAIQTLFN
jgi:signal recognition particle receptor subunit alpha